jgi:DNA-3-methyladenine glycosylase
MEELSPVTKLPREFYLQDTLVVARQLLGKLLVHEGPSGRTAGRIVEAEAYLGPWDRAAHSYNNHRSKRNEAMYGPGGHAYVFQIYGMHHCFNIVTRHPGEPQAVLIRALEPVEGLELMARRRRLTLTGGGARNLVNGPGKLCQAMGITGELNGEDLCGSRLYLAAGVEITEADIDRTPRVNIDYAGEARDYLWRFLVLGSPYASGR